MDVSRKEEEKSDFANTRSVVVGHFSMYTFNLKRFCVLGLDCSPFFAFVEFWVCGLS
jgi:hypothetical protein